MACELFSQRKNQRSYRLQFWIYRRISSYTDFHHRPGLTIYQNTYAPRTTTAIFWSNCCLTEWRSYHLFAYVSSQAWRESCEIGPKLSTCQNPQTRHCRRRQVGHGRVMLNVVRARTSNRLELLMHGALWIAYYLRSLTRTSTPFEIARFYANGRVSAGQEASSILASPLVFFSIQEDQGCWTGS